MVIVHHLSSDRTLEYSCSPEEAVIAAYAQEKGDYNTWEYRQKYGSLVAVTTSKRFVSCGDWAARL